MEQFVYSGFTALSKFLNGVEFCPFDGVWPTHRSTSHCGTLLTLRYCDSVDTLHTDASHTLWMVHVVTRYKVSTYDNKVKLNTCTYIHRFSG